MAVLLNTKRETFDVILSFDTALDVTEEEFELYKETLNETHLRFKEGQNPTRFVLRQVLPFALAKKVQNDQITTVNGKMEVQLSFIPEEVKAALVDIKNPPELPEDQQIKFEKDKDGSASEKLMELLMAAGVVQELYNARQLKLGSVQANLKKK